MKILILSNYYPPHFVGGYELACKRTVDYLKSKGHDITVLTSNYQSEQSTKSVIRQLNFINYQTPSYRNKWEVERHNYELTKEVIESVNPDLVYIWNLRLVSLSPLYAVQDLKCKKVFEFGDFWPDSYLKKGWKASLKRQVKALLPNMIGGKIDLSPSICVSQWMVKQLEKNYGCQSIQVIPNGTPLQPKSMRDYPAPEQTIKLLYCGRLDPEKGLHMALEALGKLLQEGRENFTLTIAGAGDPNYIQNCQQLIDQYELNSRVMFVGQVQNTTELYLSHDVLLMPTLMREPFGLVIIEAMAAGMAVVASNAFGPAEIIEDGKTGHLFQYGNLQSLKHKLKCLFCNPTQIKTLGSCGRKTIESQYSLNTVKAKVESYLYEVVAR